MILLFVRQTFNDELDLLGPGLYVRVVIISSDKLTGWGV